MSTMDETQFGTKLEDEFQAGRIMEYGVRGHIATVIMAGESRRRYASCEAGVWNVAGLGW